MACPIYNDREGGNVALDALTITTFDYSGAHPDLVKIITITQLEDTPLQMMLI
jgi:hypothetical protein